MTRKQSSDDMENNFSGLSEEAGARLAERRQELGATLRDIAAQAEVSASHLSEIENGRSQVSLPVLLRLVRALDLTISELLPRIGGQRVRGGSLGDLGPGSHTLSHDELELVVEYRQLEPRSSVLVENPSLADLLVHVIDGQITIDAAGQSVDLGPGDTFDSERLPMAKLTAAKASTALTITRSEQT
ncbi:MAG: helix-turn-helix transcriptional regulator [Actinomycetota bacterium]